MKLTSEFSHAFANEDLVSCCKKIGTSLVRLGLIGRCYASETDIGRCLMGYCLPRVNDKKM